MTVFIVMLGGNAAAVLRTDQAARKYAQALRTSLINTGALSVHVHVQALEIGYPTDLELSQRMQAQDVKLANWWNGHTIVQSRF